MWKCPRCETLNTDDICIICGQKSVDLENQEYTEQEHAELNDTWRRKYVEEKNYSENETKQQKSKKSVIALIVIIAVAIFIVAAILYNPTSIRFNQNGVNLYMGDRTELALVIKPQMALNKNVTWTTGDANVASVNDGQVWAYRAGTVDITATTANGKTAVCTVTIQKPSVILTDNNVNLWVGETEALGFTTSPSGQDTTWTSSDTSIASVSNNGTITANGSGTAAITAEITYKGIKCSNTCSVKVTSTTSFAQNVLDLINSTRTKSGLPALKTNTAIQSAAAARAKELATDFSWTRPDGRDWTTALDYYGVNYTYATGWIWSGATTPESVANLDYSAGTNPATTTYYNYCGVGVYRFSDGTVYVNLIMYSN